MGTLFMASDPVRNFADASACDTARYSEYFRHMLERGIYVPPSQFEAMFVSLAHEERHVDELAGAARRVLGSM
jgi:glutamate-1-semialdehyde 2,1-aminomutase